MTYTYTYVIELRTTGWLFQFQFAVPALVPALSCSSFTTALFYPGNPTYRHKSTAFNMLEYDNVYEQ